MGFTTPESLASVLFHLKWSHNGVRHVDGYYGRIVNFWRDVFPNGLREDLLYKSVGEEIEWKPVGETFFGEIANGKQTISPDRFDDRFLQNTRLIPRPGRFFPKGTLKGIPGVFKENMTPFRMAGVGPSGLRIDLNHPLAGKAISVTAKIQKVMAKIAERGGTLTDWMETMADGPGMQARINGSETDFFSDNPFEREDESDDAHFYKTPRLVGHIDARAIGEVTEIHRRLLRPGDSVLDLMSSWQSHLPDIDFARVTGLGMNAAELSANSRLTDHVVHDVNQNPRLPFPKSTFDTAVCAVSVEYATRPFELFDAVAEVLKPNGVFVVTFTNRRFPTKAIRIWREIHEFERMGLVLEFFLRSKRFSSLETYSIRGLPRPTDDKYHPEKTVSDPIFAVSGRKSS